ncbi:formate/nitrite transporter family protein [Pseudoramibacter sp.]|jgi:nitrite transporter NirC|uniref:formate/nitrite transporter family protein n=1 Tax=Pseudoramibacter sp. TaxID=2034862 RepID=UPI0025D482BD|nr:formate/nitrite transporter family protein [Pseudoramibacter sp.]MCH4073187.1 formate/nitrite transporter family protein [Pseudoramibacter sp.]MCH4106959.1 formate/nitrite transporter family protein [Pseudoramibacter sp.]
MYQKEVDAAANAAAAKSGMLGRNPGGYFVLSMLAGAYIGFGNILINVVGGLMNGAPGTKVVMGAAFGIALSLVVIAGAELFTGNNLVMSIGVMKKKVTLGDAVKLWIVCWIGNLAGSFLLAALFHFSGLNVPAVATFLATGAAAKMAAPFGQLVIRGILCNVLVCLAIWSSFRTQNDVAKLIMVFWCLFAFVICGYEHSVANMTQLSVALFDPAGQAVSVGGYFYNLLSVTLGNMIGGIAFVALPYYAGQLKDSQA